MTTPFDPTRLFYAAKKLEEAQRANAGNLANLARLDIQAVAMALLSELGVEHRGLAVVEALIEEARTRGRSEWDIAVEQGHVIEEQP
jgi:hypothetical protein